ncbi:VOC family protein [Pseudooceanicola sp. CBS1P-1]|uniref:VOC family protein n=1 Tax=Pseudooceanicola albus TaxID=2692189 RepID=A0A6L7G6W2_9RHOB|nr:MULTISPECIES: VOC family protein [Pseudooceanicola]MBT9386161.1 VOC family protein [Pseudooceanicola endophyticus]MXN19422.1 VOC family protein [Pseudooceanicola albus]
MIRLEHANITVSNPQATAAWLCDVFGWQIRWQGASREAGKTIHVGTQESYVALFNFGGANMPRPARYRTQGMLNHLAVFTEEDIGAVEARVIAAGFEPINHHDYAPGRRFYFLDDDGIEWEVASHQGLAMAAE